MRENRLAEGIQTSSPSPAIPDEREQAALAEIAALREAGQSLVAISDTMREREFSIAKQSVLNILNRQAAGAAAWPVG